MPQAPPISFGPSLDRCLGHPRFLDRFYEIFMASSPEIAARFSHTDFERQKAALTQSLYLMVLAMQGGRPAIEYLDRVARRHGRESLDVRPELYDGWLECLIRTVREHDPEFSDEIERGWRETMRFGIEFMRARY
jgi:hemoglobin-like flavoprotein